MRILEKYVLKEFIHSFFFAMVVFLFLFIIIDSFTHLDDFSKSGTAFAIIIRYYAAAVPSVFVQCAPIASLLAMVYTMGKLNYNNELIAMRSGGMSIYRIVSPVIVAGIVLSLSIFLLSEKIAPRSQEAADKIKNQYIEAKPSAAEVLNNLAIYGFSNRQFFVNTFNTKTNTLTGLTILEHDNRQNVIAKLFAQNITWKENRWVADKCFVYKFDVDNRLSDYKYHENYVVPIEEKPEDFLRQHQQMSYMSSAELRDYIKKLKGSGAETAIRNLHIDLYQKMIAPFTCLIMIFIGIPCSMAIRRKAVGFSSVGISILIALLYYVLQAVSIALGKNNIFPVAASVMLTPLIFVCSSMYLINVSP